MKLPCTGPASSCRTLTRTPSGATPALSKAALTFSVASRLSYEKTRSVLFDMDESCFVNDPRTLQSLEALPAHLVAVAVKCSWRILRKPVSVHGALPAQVPPMYLCKCKAR